MVFCYNFLLLINRRLDMRVKTMLYLILFVVFIPFMIAFIITVLRFETSFENLAEIFLVERDKYPYGTLPDLEPASDKPKPTIRYNMSLSEQAQ